MKKHFLIFSPSAFFLVLFGLLCSAPYGSGQKPAKAGKGIEMPAQINIILKNSCMPCHSNGGKEMAKVLLNFSKWNNYGRRSQVQKCRAICKMITKDEMPPAQFKESNPDLILSRMQKDSICNWVNQIVLKKQ
jgi:hypothetical protein